MDGIAGRNRISKNSEKYEFEYREKLKKHLVEFLDYQYSDAKIAIFGVSIESFSISVSFWIDRLVEEIKPVVFVKSEF